MRRHYHEHREHRPGRGRPSRRGSARSGRLYRSRSGMIMGVCRGIAEYFDISVFGVRAVAVALLIFTGLWPVVGIYLLAALIMKPEPVVPIQGEADQEFYNSYTTSRTAAVSRLKRTFDNLDRRLNRMEDLVTSRERDWERRFNQS